MEKLRSVPMVLIVLGIGFCLGSGARELSAGTGETVRRGANYNLITTFRAWPGWANAADALEQYQRSYPGVVAHIGGPLDGDAGKQIEDLNATVVQGSQGIILAAADKNSLVQAVKNAVANHVPVVSIFNDTPDSGQLTYIAADEVGSAQRLVRKVLAQLPPRQSPEQVIKVLISYPGPGMTCVEERLQGTKEVLASVPWVRVVDTIRDNADDAKGAEAIAAAWTRAQGVDLIIGLGGRSGMAAVSALRELGIPKGTALIVGWDNDLDQLQAMRDGWIYAASAPNIGFMNQLALFVLEGHQRGFLYPDEETRSDKGVPVLPRRIDIEQTLIDPSNIEAYLHRFGVHHSTR